jgi:hypothetical protein
MAVPVPRISCCVLNHLNFFTKYRMPYNPKVEHMKDASIVEGIFCVISVYFVQHSLDFETTDFSFDHFGKFRSI